MCSRVYELAFARERARQPLQRAGLLLLLKTFQRLGYFALCAEIPLRSYAISSAAPVWSSYPNSCKPTMPVRPGIDTPL